MNISICSTGVGRSYTQPASQPHEFKHHGTLLPPPSCHLLNAHLFWECITYGASVSLAANMHSARDVQESLSLPVNRKWTTRIPAVWLNFRIRDSPRESNRRACSQEQRPLHMAGTDFSCSREDSRQARKIAAKVSEGAENSCFYKHLALQVSHPDRFLRIGVKCGCFLAEFRVDPRLHAGFPSPTHKAEIESLALLEVTASGEESNHKKVELQLLLL